MPKPAILLVDDEPHILKALERSLHRLDYHILTAPDGRSALAVLEQTHVDLLITDYRMPEVSGEQLLEIVRHLYPGLSRIMLTGYSSLDESQSIVESGLAHVLIRKPWNEDELRDLIASMLQGDYHDHDSNE